MIIASHLDTVPDAGAFDGILGVVMGIALVDALAPRRLAFSIEVIGFSEEEGVRFGVPFIGSRALVGSVDEALLALRDRRGLSVADAIRAFDLDPARLPEAKLTEDAMGCLEFHIEQGPILESLNKPLGIVETIVGQSRISVCFAGKAGHAGTTSMKLRRDALAGAAEWITLVERVGASTPELVATVGRLEIEPNAGNVIAGKVRASLDVRHAIDDVRHQALDRMIKGAAGIAADRGLVSEWEQHLNQPAIAMNSVMVKRLEQAAKSAGCPVYHMASGAGHDAMIVAQRIPTAMLFLRSPGGVSHHPSENVLVDDVQSALKAGIQFLEQWENAP